MDVPLKGVIVYDSHTCASFRDGFATLNPKPYKPYKGTSLIRNRAPLGPYSRSMPRLLW